MASEHSESQETNSTSLVEDALNISFEDISYTVRDGFLAGGKQAFTLLRSLFTWVSL